MRGVTAGGGGLTGIAAALVCGHHVIADLDLFHAVDDLDRQSALADELATVDETDHPEAEAVLGIETAVPRDPALRLVPGLGAGVVPHDLLIAEQRGDVVEIRISHLAEGQTVGVQRLHRPSLTNDQLPAATSGQSSTLPGRVCCYQ